MITDLQTFPLQGKQFLVRAKVEPPFRFNVPMPDEACFYFVTSGVANVYTPTEIVKLDKNGIVLQCGSYLNEYIKTTDCDYCEAIAIHLYPDIIKSIYGDSLPDFLRTLQSNFNVVYEKIEASSILKSFVESLEFYFSNPKLVDEEILKLKAKELLIILAKTNQLEIVKSIFLNVLEPENFDFKTIIDANLYNDLSIEELAFLSGFSLSTFKRQFKKVFNSTPAKYIKTKKLEKAAILIKTSSKRISDIAFSVGFSDLSHFSKSFQSVYKVPPSKYQ